MTGSCFGSPRFSASLPSQAASASLPRVVAGVAARATGAARPRPRRRPRRRRRAPRGRRPRRAGGASPPMRMNLTLAPLRLARDVHDRVLVVALERGELAVLDVALEEADVPVGAEVLLAAPVVGDDVARAGLVGADDLEVVLAGLGVADPRLHRGPAAALHLVAVLAQRPRHEARAPRVAGPDARRLEVLVDLGAGVGALLLHAELGLRGLQGRRAEACSSPTPAPRRRRRRPRRGPSRAAPARSRARRA